MTFAAMPTTRFARLPRPAAMLAMALLVVSIVTFLGFAVTAPETPSGLASTGDKATYERIVTHMRQGEDYYTAARTELTRGRYAMQSVFNWRTPLLASFMALFPNNLWPQAIVAVVGLGAAALACWLAFGVLGPIGAGALVVIEMLSLGDILVPDSIVFSEIPCGILILLSVAAYGTERARLGQGAAIFALFLRELAAPYVVICLFLAFRDRRYAECRRWGLALLGYAIYFGWHYVMVRAHQQPGDLVDPNGWVQFGGAAFVLATSAFNGVLFVAPLWVAAIITPLAVLGLLAWPGAAGQRMALTVVAYLAAFAIIGQHFNFYWGALYTPVLSVGLIFAPAGLRDLWGALKVPAIAGSGQFRRSPPS